jgi:hypothetical protein
LNSKGEQNLIIEQKQRYKLFDLFEFFIGLFIPYTIILIVNISLILSLNHQNNQMNNSSYYLYIREKKSASLESTKSLKNPTKVSKSNSSDVIGSRERSSPPLNDDLLPDDKKEIAKRQKTSRSVSFSDESKNKSKKKRLKIFKIFKILISILIEILPLIKVRRLLFQS